MSEASKKLHELFASEWDYQLEQYPTWASKLGDRHWNDRWGDRSLDAIDKRYSHNVEVLIKLRAMDRDALSSPDRLNYDLFLNDYQIEVEGHQYRWYLLPLNQLGGVQTADDLAEALRFDTLKDYEDWLARLHALPDYIEQTIALMREGIKQQILLPKIVLERIPTQIDHQIVSDPKESPFYKPFSHFANSIAETDQSRLIAAAENAIRSDIVPAFRRLKEFFVKDYLPASPGQVGIWQLPQGEEMYGFAVGLHTTTNMTPQEIHEIGLREVARIRGEMQSIIDTLGYKSIEEFAEFLRRDPQFYFSTPEELLVAYQSLDKTHRPSAGKNFPNSTAHALRSRTYSGKYRAGYYNCLLSLAGSRRFSRRDLLREPPQTGDQAQV